jgi:hypothetical protein
LANMLDKTPSSRFLPTDSATIFPPLYADLRIIID